MRQDRFCVAIRHEQATHPRHVYVWADDTSGAVKAAKERCMAGEWVCYILTADEVKEMTRLSRAFD